MARFRKTAKSSFLPCILPHLSHINISVCGVSVMVGRAIAQAVSRRLPTAAARVQTPGSGHVGFCDGQKWRWGTFSPRRTSVSPANLHSFSFSTIIFTTQRGGQGSNPSLVMWDFVMDKSGAGAGFLRGELRFPLPIYVPSSSPQSSSLSPEAGTTGRDWPQCQ
jgi:hypothetical protein